MTPSDDQSQTPQSDATSDKRVDEPRGRLEPQSNESGRGEAKHPQFPAPTSDPDPFHRLHPLSLIFGIARLGKGFLLPAIVVLLFARKGTWEVWLMVLFVPLAIFEVYRYITLRYRIDQDRLIIKQGLLFRRERHIPLSRVQNIDLVQNVAHRLLKVAEVRIETAGGSKPEASFKVLTLHAVESLRTQVFEGRAAQSNSQTNATTYPLAAGRASADSAPTETGIPSASATPASPPSREIHRIPPIELIKLGLISNRGLALIVIVLGLAWEFDVFDRIDYARALRFIHDETVAFGWMHATALAIAALILLRVLSVGWVLLRFFDYRLTRHGEDFHLSCGLLTRITATVPRRRIQLVSIHQTLLQRMLQRASIRIETAGGGGGGNDGERDTHAAVSRRWFVPTIPVSLVPRILCEVREGLDEEVSRAHWESLAPNARRRMMGKSLRIALILVIGIAAIFRPWGFLAAVILVPLSLWHAHRSARFLSCARTPRGIAFRSGAWTRRISATFFDKMQLVSLRESPFDRRWRMATLCIDTAGAGPADHVIRVPYLTQDAARTLASDFTANAERAEFRW